MIEILTASGGVDNTLPMQLNYFLWLTKTKSLQLPSGTAGFYAYMCTISSLFAWLLAYHQEKKTVRVIQQVSGRSSAAARDVSARSN